MAQRLQTATTLLKSGRPKKAYQEARAAMRETPRSPDPHNVAGMALSAMGRHSEAAKSFFKATQIAPNFDNARRNLAQALILDGKTDKARQVLTGFLKKNPLDETGWYLLGQCEMVAGNLSAAEDATTQAIDAARAVARHKNQRAAIREKRGNLDGAIADYEAALQANPQSVETLVNMSLPLARQLRSEEALDVVNRAVELAPDHVGARLRLAMHLLEAGQSDDAAQAFRDVLRLDSSNAIAMEQLSQLQSPEHNKVLKSQVLRAIKKAPRRSEERASLFFALAHIARTEKDRTAEIDALNNANGDMRATMPYDQNADATRTDRILKRFPSGVESKETRPSGPRPIYVLGLPRSGTTLTEAILGAHPDVRPLGERAATAVLLHDTIEMDLSFDEQAQSAFREKDKEMLPQLAAEHLAYVDKMPENYRFIGFLKTAYPECKIINMVRDPKDIALSMWRGHFAGTALNYTYDLRAMSSRFNIYAHMMRHWHRVFDGQILDIRYEDLVGDLPHWSKRIAEFCELDWVEDMAAPHKTSEQVLTLSANQIRQPVHSRSIGKSRQYDDALAQFHEGLDPTLWSEAGLPPDAA